MLRASIPVVPQQLPIVIAVISAGGLAAIAEPVTVRTPRRGRDSEIPNQRSSHSVSAPRGCKAPIAIGLVVAAVPIRRLRQVHVGCSDRSIRRPGGRPVWAARTVPPAWLPDFKPLNGRVALSSPGPQRAVRGGRCAGRDQRRVALNWVPTLSVGEVPIAVGDALATMPIRNQGHETNLVISLGGE